MKKIGLGILIGIFIFFIFQFYQKENQHKTEIIENTALIQKQIKNVGKLVVTEGYFSEIITYKDAKKYLANWISFDKKALVVVNAEATISYDLSQIRYEIDEQNKIVKITNIPPSELKIYPNIEYYDIEMSQFNPFTATDHNLINKKVNEIMKQKIEKSSLKQNAENRLLTELSKLLILTNSMGWTLEYNHSVIQNEEDFRKKTKG
ncbi:MAG: DUF4230 domain-containing protein [Capnocytophaga sp.]|nr:DUF4230 domain-containing protein [Capnocytophaga sp.]